MGNNDLGGDLRDTESLARLEGMLERLSKRQHESSDDTHNVIGKAKDLADAAKKIFGLFWTVLVFVVAGTIWVWSLKVGVDDNKERIIQLRKDVSENTTRLNKVDVEMANKVSRKPDF